MPTFVIEHLEPELYDWCILEYKHISSFVGKENLLFTNISDEKLNELGKTDARSIIDMPLEHACVLDPEAPQTLTPELAKQFDYFIFGGILGDDPPKERTKDALSDKLPYPIFNLGKAQMSTDTAVIVTKLICDGTPLENMQFAEGLEVHITEGESVMLPYRYLILNDTVLLAPGIVDLLKEQESF